MPSLTIGARRWRRPRQLTEFGELELEIDVVEVANNSIAKRRPLSRHIGSASAGYD